MTNKKTFVSLLLAVIFITLGLCSVLMWCRPVEAQAEAQTVDVYAINDFHGAVTKMPRVAGYLAARKAEGAVIINSGDMFQGSMESNSNFGKLLTDCMVEAKTDAMTLGNHEFDWGLDNLRELSQNSGVPFLGANIYNWDRSSGWGDFADDLVDEYVIVESGDLKVGVIGVIGESQITSINAQLVQTIGFKDPLPIIKELATELREEKDCDVVVVSAHAGCQEIVGEEENYNQPSTTAELENYVDGMFCAHTHSQQKYVVNGLPFLQGKNEGAYVSHIRFSVDNGNVSATTYENISYSSLGNIDATAQSGVQTLIDNSNALIAEERNQKLATLSSSLTKANQIPRLVCHAIADYVGQYGVTIDLAITNGARENLSAGSVTYTALYEALPFDNVVYIAKVTGKELLKEASYSNQSIWRVSGRAISDSNQYYYIAVIDYLLYHQNARRNYNYFASAFSSGLEPIPLVKKGVKIYNYRLITRDFLLKQEGTLDTTPYTSGSDIHTNTAQLSSAVNLPVVPYNFDGLADMGSEITIPNPSGDADLGKNTPDSTLMIVLIVVGSLIVVGVVVTVIVISVRRKRKK